MRWLYCAIAKVRCWRGERWRDRDLYEFARLKVLKQFMAMNFLFSGAELIEVEER